MQILLKEYILNRIQSFTNKFQSSANRIKFLIAGIVFHTRFQFKYRLNIEVDSVTESLLISRIYIPNY